MMSHAAHSGGRRRLHTAESAAEQMSISRAKIYQMIKSGEIESIKIDRSRRIPDDAITAYIERRRSQPSEAA